MNITISWRHWDREKIEGMIERINKAVIKINSTVRTLESKDDLENLKKVAHESAIELDKRIHEQHVAINRYRSEIDTLTGRLNKCGIFDGKLKKYFKKEISKFDFKISRSEDVIRSLQRQFDAQVNNFTYYNLNIPTPQEKDKAVADHRKFVAYEYNPNIRLLNNLLGENIPVADPEEVTELETIDLKYDNSKGYGRFHSVSIDQSGNSEEEME